MSEVEEKVAQLRREVTLHQQQRARAEHERDQAQASYDAAWKLLQEEFGMQTPQEAGGLLKTLEADLAAEASRVHELLARAGEGQ